VITFTITNPFKTGGLKKAYRKLEIGIPQEDKAVSIYTEGKRGGVKTPPL